MDATGSLMMVSARSVRPVLAQLEKLDVDVPALLEAAGVDRSDLDQADARIPHVAALAIWREAVARSRDANFGIHAAESLRAGMFDVLDYAIRSSATLGAGLERLVRYHRILHDGARVELLRDGGGVRLTHTLPIESAVLPRHAAEFIVAGWLIVARQATDTALLPNEVTFCHLAPTDLTEHRRVFGAPVRFGSSANGLTLSFADLEVPLVKADAGLCAVLERHVREIAARMPTASSLAERVRGMLASELSDGAPDAQLMSRRLHMSPRTLQRRLNDEGTTLRRLADELRRDLATRYLADERLAAGEIAFLLGFADESAFYRAFKRWNGCTPAAYRRAGG